MGGGANREGFVGFDQRQMQVERFGKAGGGIPKVEASLCYGRWGLTG